MVDDLPARVAALELLVEQLIYERVQLTEDPAEALRLAMGGMASLAGDRPDVPSEAVGAVADILARVIRRIE